MIVATAIQRHANQPDFRPLPLLDNTQRLIQRKGLYFNYFDCPIFDPNGLVPLVKQMGS